MWIQTYRGRAYEYFKHNDISLEDVARALSRQCRYAGHTTNHYSVAEHSCHVGDYLATRRKPKSVILGGYLHDAHEAFIGDMPSPLKLALREMSSDFRLTWSMLERCVDADILAAVGCEVQLHHPDIKAVDMRLLHDEKAAIWGSQEAMPWQIPGAPLGVKIHFWPPERAEEEWLHRVSAYSSSQTEETSMWVKDGNRHVYTDAVTGLPHAGIYVIEVAGYVYYTVPGDDRDGCYQGAFDLDVAKMRCLKAWHAETIDD